MVLGGGGYVIRNVARCWTYETAICTEQDLQAELPFNTEYFEYFAPDFSLFPDTNPRQENANSRQYLESIMESMHNQLKMVQHAPSVQMQDMPNSVSNHLKVDLEDILDPDERTNDIEEERRTAEHDGEFYDGDRDQDGDSLPTPAIRTNGNSGGMTNAENEASK